MEPSDNETIQNIPLSNETINCSESKHELILVKFVLLSVAVPLIAVFGVFGNVTTALVMSRPSMQRSSNSLYLATLAVFDTLLLVPSVLLYSLELFIEYMDFGHFYGTWIHWVPYCYAVGHFAQTGSVYTTVVAAFERYMVVLYPKHAVIQCTKDRALLMIAAVTCFSAIFNSTKFFEITVAHNNACTGFAAYWLDPSPLLEDSFYVTAYSLYLTQFVMVFFPFGVLLTANTAIVYNFRKSLKRFDGTNIRDTRRRISVRHFDGSETLLERGVLKEQSRDATRVLATIVVIFLICNSPGFVVTLLENIYSPKYLGQNVPRTYAICRDMVNFLAIVNSSINFVVCCVFGEDFRCELAAMFGRKESMERLLSRRRRKFVGGNTIRRKSKKRSSSTSTHKSVKNGSVSTNMDHESTNELLPLHTSKSAEFMNSHATIYSNAQESVFTKIL